MTVAWADATLIDGFYGAATDAGLWPSLLEGLGNAFGGRQATLYGHDLLRCGADIQAQWGVEAGYARSYVEHFGRLNPFVAGVGRLAVGVSAVADELVAPSRYDASEFFNDWVRPQGGREFLTTVLLREGDAMTGFTVLRDGRRFSPEERRRWDGLMPHAKRALDMHHALHRARLLRDAALGALETLSVGAILTDERSEILYANPSAERQWGRGSGLEIRQGRLCGRTPAATEALVDAIRSAVAAASARMPRQNAVLVMPRDHGPGLPVLVAAVPADHRPDGPGRKAALVLVGGARGLRARRADLARAFGLTGAESGLLVGLVDGQPLADYAAGAGITVETARKHLRNVLAKTGTKRQSDAIRRVLEDAVLTSSASLPEDG